MRTDTPYIIKHIQLDALLQNEAIVAAPGFRYYFSCWWKGIPLGHLFVEHNEQPEPLLLHQKIWDAVAPAIHLYMVKSNVKADVHRSYFVHQQYKPFCLVMDRIFSAYTPEAWPNNSDISVIICTRNRSSDLQRCLNSMVTQTCPPREIIVVDNAPSDDSTLNVVKQFKQVLYYKELRGGLSIARNSGLRMATSSIVAFTDDDVVTHPLWLCYVKESFEASHVGAMTGLIIASSLTTQSQQLFEKQWSFNGGYCDKQFDHSFFTKNLATGPRVWDIGAGANMAFRKSALDIAGSFDERLGAGAAGCSEDSEMWYRLLAKGFAIHYNPRAVVFHEHRKELSALHRQIFSYMRGHAVAALIQQEQIENAGYRRYLYRKIFKGYLPLLIKRFYQPAECKMLLIQIHGMISGVFYFFRNRNKPPQRNFF